MKFIINWTEEHNPENWGEEELKAIENLLNNKLNATLTSKNPNDGWVTIECADFFEANNYTELKQRLTTYETDKYKVADETGVIQFTEEDYKSLETLKVF